MSRSERLLDIVTYLRGRRTAVTARELAEAFSVSERTIYRDILSLQLAGNDIQGEAGIGYCLNPKNSLPPMTFTEKELSTLMLGLKLAASVADEQTRQQAASVVNKIRAVIPANSHFHSHLQQSPFAVVPQMPKERRQHLDLLRQATQSKTKLEIAYLDAEGQSSQRVICPLGLLFWGTSWVLVAWCELRQAYRSFRLDRVSQLQVTEHHFSSDAGFSFQRYLQQYQKQVTDFWSLD